MGGLFLLLEEFLEDVFLLGFLCLILGFLLGDLLLGPEEVAQLELHLGLHLEVAHLIDIGKGEGAIPVHHLLGVTDRAFGQGAVAGKLDLHVLQTEAAIACLIDGGLDLADGELTAAVLLTDHGGAGLVDVDGEVGLGAYIVEFGHL